MDRRNVGTEGAWFDASKAQVWDEDTKWNGNNHISLATGSQWSHQRLFRTASGKWIVENTSQYQGSMDSYEEVTPAAAAAWLVVNNHEPHETIADDFAALEL